MVTNVAKSRGWRPDYCFNRATDINREWLEERGITGLIVDIDNTLRRWELKDIPDPELAWLKAMDAAGIRIRLLSNGLPHKVASAEKQTGVAHVRGRPIKPLAHAFIRGVTEMGLECNQVLMIGDSVVTDIVMANRLGIWTCLVDPISNRDFPGSKFWRMVEFLFQLRKPCHCAGDFRSEQNANTPDQTEGSSL